MAKKQRTQSQSTQRVPKVRIARPGGRRFQLRYRDPETKKEVRISIKSRDESEAESEKKKLEAKLLLNQDPKPKKKLTGPNMPWDDFREEYSRLKVATFRSEKSKAAAEIRLDVCESIVRPRKLNDMAQPETLSLLQAELLAGTGSKQKRRRAAKTVESYMRALKAALNWGHKMKWLPEPCRFEMIECDDDETAKGRPLTSEEFQAMLAACDVVCGSAAPSWKFLLRGLWESGLRLGEAMNVRWEGDTYIVPLRTKKGGYLLRIPGRMQKNRKTQEVPTTPLLGALLDEVPDDQRTGWVFNPAPLRSWNRRLTPEQAGRIISEIGEKAGVIVSDSGKFASAHDLRRSFGQRMADAGIPTRDLQAIMRHASITTTEKYYLRHRAADQAERIAMYLNRGAECTGIGNDSAETTGQVKETAGAT